MNQAQPHRRNPICKMKSVFVASALFLLLSSQAGSAEAKDFKVCNELAKGDAAACQQAAHAKCDSVQGYWPQQKCADAVAATFNECANTDTYAKTCEERKAAYHDVCMKAGELDMNKPESIAEFKRRALAYKDTLAKAEAFETAWGMCFDERSVPTCGGSRSDVAQCERAGKKFKETFAGAVDFYLGSVLKNNFTHIDSFMKSRDFGAAKSTASSARETLAILQKLHYDLPDLRHRAKDVDIAVEQLGLRMKDVDKAFEKSLSKVRCPKSKGNNKSVLKTLSPAVDGFFASTKDTKTTVKAFRLNGKKQKSRDNVRKITTESYPGFACTEKVKKDETFCQVFSISVKRKKVDKQPSGPWATYVGSSERMLCKNLK